MRRLLSLVLALCLLVTQTVAAECSLAPGQPRAAGEGGVPQAPVSGAAHHQGGGHGVSHRAAPAPRRDTAPEREGRSPAHHAPAGCAVVMACGVAALPPSPAPSSHVPVPAAPALARDDHAYLSPALGTDPPPPRPSARN